VLRLRGSSRVDWKSDRLCDISKKIDSYLHLTEDRAPLFLSSGIRARAHFKKVGMMRISSTITHWQRRNWPSWPNCSRTVTV
jgi:hypothetical protein